MEAFIYLKVKASLGHYILLHIVEHNSSKFDLAISLAVS